MFLIFVSSTKQRARQEEIRSKHNAIWITAVGRGWGGSEFPRFGKVGCLLWDPAQIPARVGFRGSLPRSDLNNTPPKP